MKIHSPSKIGVFWTLLAIITLYGCDKSFVPQTHFYYWKSNARLGELEKETFETLQAEKLYIRLFDIDKKPGTQPEPVGVINAFDTTGLNAVYIPVVFITNRVFTGLTQEEIKLLAVNTHQLIGQISKKNKPINYGEIQIDCDWTNTTQSAFFSFLEHLKQLSNTEISCTLRLHQVKYKESTGIPPVDKVYLMAYATSSPLEDTKLNSILDLALLEDYLQTINEYPLPFDVALPLYSWAIVTNHLGEKKLINGVSTQELENENFEKNNSSTYTVLQDVFVRGMWLNKGFTVKVEAISPQLLRDTKIYFRKKIKQPYNLIYYHLDSLFLERFSIDDLEG
ncbi:hypothetical protein [Algoriphagus sp. Y33]|uniref:hypothetical protein n=1 Tax=Algoriphagus sp. Y33 TaxID=2772483 RepID=UPI00177F7325|nr:hypothetical protein [Algoriphagus sp. Y33]